MNRRQFILLLGGGSAAATSVGTGAFSSVSADREVSVNVVEDDEAYLRLTATPDEETLVQVRNQFTGPLELTLSATVGSSSSSVEVNRSGEKVVININSGNGDTQIDSTTADIETGTDLDIAVNCGTAGTYTVELSFHGEVEESGTTVDKDREFTETTITAVQFPGNSGKAEIESKVGGSVNGTAYYRNEESTGSIESYSLENQEVGVKFGPETEGIDGEVVAVDLDDLDGVFWRADRKNGSGNRVDLETAAERDRPPSS